MNPTMDILVHFSWSTCALRMEFWSYFTIIQRQAEHLEELEIRHTEEKIKGKERHMIVVSVFQSAPRRKNEKNPLLVLEFKMMTKGGSHI